MKAPDHSQIMEHAAHTWIFALGGTMFVIVIALAAIAFILRKSRLNWYEQNILDMAKADPEYIRYCKRNLRHQDSELGLISNISQSSSIQSSPTNEKPSSTHDSRKTRLQRTQSKIVYDKQISHKPHKPLPVTVEGDWSEKFTVPIGKSRSANNLSMYKSYNEKQIDVGLYDQRKDTSASSAPVTGQCGCIKIALFYDCDCNLLHLGLLQADELTTPRPDGPPSPYFKVAITMPDHGAMTITKQSKTYKDTTSPEMNEEMCFEIGLNELGHCKLEVLVYDYDQYSVDECIGYCWLTLNRLDISTEIEDPTIFWAEVLPFQWGQDTFGEILFSITYLAKAQRLTVSIFKVRNLPNNYMVEAPDPAIRVTLSVGGKRLKRKKTNHRRGTLNPTYNEALTFNIPKSSLCEVVLDLEVTHEPGTFCVNPGRVLARLHLPLHRCKELWKALIHGENSLARWHALESP